MGIFGGGKNKAAKLEFQIAKKETKLAEVKKNMPQPPPPQLAQMGQAKTLGVKNAAGQTAALDIQGVATDLELAQLRDYTDKQIANVRSEVNALDDDIGRLAMKSKIRSSGGDSSGMLLPLLLLGGLGGSSSSSSSGIDSTTLLLIVMAGGLGGDGDGGSDFMSLILLTALL